MARWRVGLLISRRTSGLFGVWAWVDAVRAQNRCAAPIMHHVAAGEWTPRGEQASLQETTCSLLMAGRDFKKSKQAKDEANVGWLIYRAVGKSTGHDEV